MKTEEFVKEVAMKVKDMNRKEVEIAILEKLLEIKKIKEEYDDGEYLTLVILGDHIAVNNEYYEEWCTTPINACATLSGDKVTVYEHDTAETFEMKGEENV